MPPDSGDVMPPVEARLALARIEIAEGRPAQAAQAWSQALAAEWLSASDWLLRRCARRPSGGCRPWAMPARCTHRRGRSTRSWH